MSNQRHFAILRIIFGFIWLINAYLQWQPSFFSGFVSYLTNGINSQPVLVQSWIHLWINLVSINPHLFAMIIAASETAVALGLIFGLFPKLVSYSGIAFALIVWSTAEGFGGPYLAGSTDVGAAIIYVLVFVALLLGGAWDGFNFKSVLHH